MYLPLDLTISEPEPVNTSTTDSSTSTAVTERPTTLPPQRQAILGSQGIPTPSTPAPSLAPPPSIMKPSIVIPRHSNVNLNDYLIIEEEERSDSERVALQQLLLEITSTLPSSYRPF